MARPTKYSIDIAEIICSRITAGEYVIDIAKDVDMPSERTIYEWKAKHPVFSQMYAQAREAWADAEFENLIAIADDSGEDYRIDPESGVEVFNSENVARSRLRVETRKWALAKVNKKYGEHRSVDVTNSDGSLGKDTLSIAHELAALLAATKQAMLTAPPVTDAEFVDVIDDGSDLC